MWPTFWQIILLGVLPFLLCSVFASFFEWGLHKYIMHRRVKTPFGTFDYAFQAHAIVHHEVFDSGPTYHLKDEKDKDTIRMAWWNGPVLICVGTCMVMIIVLITDFIHHGWSSNPWLQRSLLLTSIAMAFTAYYSTYEYLHWCMHLPAERLVEKSRLFHWLNGHHLLHHHQMGKNFNVVLPLADWLLGTLVRQSREPFKQPKHPFIEGGVPNVQPHPPHRPHATFFKT